MLGGETLKMMCGSIVMLVEAALEGSTMLAMRIVTGFENGTALGETYSTAPAGAVVTT